MRKLYSILVALILSVTLFAQAPSSFKYQTVVRNSSGQLITNTQVTIQIAILRGSISGDPVYIETFSPTTNDFGLVNLNIGSGIMILGNFETIDWGIDTYFIKVWFNSTEMGTSQLLSVPYALYANKAETLSENALTGNENAFIEWDKNILDDFDGKYSSLSNIPTFANIAITGDYNDLANKPLLSDSAWGSLPLGKAGQILTIDQFGKPLWVTLSGKPDATTLPVSNINGGLTTFNCNVNPNGLLTSVIFEYGIDTGYGKVILPTQNTIIGNSIIALSADIGNLAVGTTYHFRVKAINTFGTSYGEDMYFTPYYSLESIAIGQFYAGGVIFYIDETGQHGLVCASTNQSQGIQWYNGADILTDATDKLIGTGQQNTAKIIAIQGPGIYAASLCDQLELNGFNDWFMPSYDELKQMFLNRAIIGGFEMSSYRWWYWSSTEKGLTLANMWDFSRDNPDMNGEAYATKNGSGAGVRAIRTF
ncbi:hypothetical protein A2Z67_02420 [Candidatus Woesebacteria bacterium RBG_13_36_22]|uniref:Fibronectin type-III domain-containing protein n=1 Tax=Candidatus Woesebacteria bacterium RBG_13_36_22 TaxID=1802478 RepID=A0A1F7X291_9BACT|nr:MAG: hypothetical protein A2Z67_02420 [Candidatus Woesebacteria bacterium RBG_13_36_22]